MYKFQSIKYTWFFVASEPSDELVDDIGNGMYSYARYLAE